MAKSMFRENAGTLVFVCPACKHNHAVPVTEGKPWKFNGDLDNPTITPHNSPVNSGGTCIFTLTRGIIAFLPESSHAMAGMQTELPEWNNQYFMAGGMRL